jgi:hypothetical protein
LISANSAVTVLRSPPGTSADAGCSGAMRIGGGGFDGPVFGAVVPGADVSDIPHSPQNLNWGGFSNPHAAHRFFIGAAQLPQNFIPAGLSVPQLEHRIVMTLPRPAKSA